MTSIIDQIEVDYARFNAAKTLSTTTPSKFEHAHFGDLIATRDRTRSDTYYNRVLGFMVGNGEALDEAAAWIVAGMESGQRIRLDAANTGKTNLRLADRGWQLTDTLAWLRFDPDRAEASARSHNHVAPRSLTTDDWPELRKLLGAHGPIDDGTWQAKRKYLCTDSFRWIGIFVDKRLISAASTWLTSNAVVFGSAYTQPEWRGRGYQQRLLHARLRAVSGTAYVDVEPDSISYRNCIRAGFRDLEQRQVWERR